MSAAKPTPDEVYQQEQAEAAALLRQVHDSMREDISILTRILDRDRGSRELSVSRTYLETARLWLKEHGHGGRIES